MDIYLDYCDRTNMFRFPMDAFALQDVLDWVRQPDDPVVRCILVGTDVCVPELKGMEFAVNLYDLNAFAARVDKFDAEDKATFRSLLQWHPDCSFDDLLQFAFAVDSVVTYPYAEYETLGDYAIRECLLPELRGVAEEELSLLDRRQFGKQMAERYSGVFVDGFFSEPDTFESRHVTLEHYVPQGTVCQIQVAPVDTLDLQPLVWLDLPCSEDRLHQLEQDLGCPPPQMVCAGIRTLIPQLRLERDTVMEHIGVVNKLMQRLAELDRASLIKFKAVLEAERVCDPEEAAELLGTLDEYDFDAQCADENDFAYQYLCKNLPSGFNGKLLETCDMYDLGGILLMEKRGSVTHYGVVGGRGEQLYSNITAEPEQEETQEQEDEITLGGI